MNKKSIVRNIILLVALIIIVFIVLFSMNDIESIWETIKKCNYNYLLIAVALLIGYCLFFQISMTILVKRKHRWIDTFDTMCISGSEFFFNGITPFSTGGQPFQVYGFKRKGIRISDSTSILLYNFLCYQIALNIVLILSISIYFKQIMEELPNQMWLIIVGFLINFITMLVILILGRSKKAAALMMKFMKFLCKFKLFKRILGKKINKIGHSIENMQNVFKEASSHIKTTICSIILKVIAFCFYYSIPFIIYQALGVKIGAGDLFFMLAMSAFACAIAVWVPTPGATGGIEVAFNVLFSQISVIKASGDPQTLAASAMILWRFITYYLIMVYGFVSYFLFESRLKNHESRYLY